MDEIIIYFASLQQHMVHFRKVFEGLRETNFKLQLKKRCHVSCHTNYEELRLIILVSDKKS